MSHVTITMKSGKVHDFPEQQRPGGSWSNSVRYEAVFVVFKDVWGKEIAFPAADVERVDNEPTCRGGW
jgi:hypothetical protein